MPHKILGDVLIGDGRPPRGLPSLKIRKGYVQEWGEIRGRNLGLQKTLRAL